LFLVHRLKTGLVFVLLEPSALRFGSCGAGNRHGYLFTYWLGIAALR